MVGLTRALLVLAALVAAAGVATAVVVYEMVSTPGRAWDYLSATALDPRVTVSAGAAAFAWLGAALLARRPRAVIGSGLPLVVEPASEAEREVRLRALAKTINAAPLDPVGGIAAAVDALLAGALGLRASDIHIHPLAEGTRVALRIDGMLHEVTTLAPEVHQPLIGRLKVLARLVTYRSKEPQDGHFSVETAEGQAEIRVSLLPTNHGETAVLRVAGTAVMLPELARLGLTEALRERYVTVLDRAQGIVFVTGPTGSGKTTTIYASIGHIQRTRGGSTHIATIEDPIEYNVPSLSQTQVNPRFGLTFAKGLRALLRQDPNIIVVGEIRDAETAEIAGQAGLTGHLILSTVHAVSAAGVFHRLIDIGVEPFVVASASTACISQRLVRRLCRSCRRPAAPADDLRRRILAAGEELAGEQFWDADGCDYCNGSGFIGRIPVFELLVVTQRIRDLILAKAPISALHEAAVSEGMVPLVRAGLQLARDGTTNLAEIVRIGG